MRSFIKYALVGTALAASGGAYADVTLPSTGNGQAVLFVKNETTGAVYARAINVFVNSVAPSATDIRADTYSGGTNIAGADTSFSFTSLAPIAADSTLTGFLNSTNTFSWTVMMGDSLSSAAPNNGVARGEKRYVSPLVTGSLPSNTQINSSMPGFENSLLSVLNGLLSGAAGADSSVISPGPNSGLWDSTSLSTSASWFFAGGPNNKVAWNSTTGGAADLFMITSGGPAATSTGLPGQFYKLGGVSLAANGLLSFLGTNGSSEVPLPPAIWLLASALAGFGGLARRRRGEELPAVAA